MTEFVFVRHGESERNTTPDIIGGRSTSTPLSGRGERQARLLGEYFRSNALQPEYVYSSGARRADATAKLACETAKITTDERLQELHQGSFEGKNRYDVYTPKTIERYNLTHLEGKFPDGESIADVAERMERFVLDIHHEHPTDCIIVFGHGLAIRALAGRILGQTKQEILAIDTPNVSLTTITVDNNRMHVRSIGKTVISE